VLLKIFNDEKISNSDTLLNPTEYMIIRAVILRKYNFSLPSKLNVFTLAKDLDKLTTDIRPKPLRPE
jgi:hypothetical protein